MVRVEPDGEVVAPQDAVRAVAVDDRGECGQVRVGQESTVARLADVARYIQGKVVDFTA